MKPHFFRLLTLSATTALLAASQAHAAGFYLQESSVSALGAGYAGDSSSIHDASTVFNNPAGMTELNGRQFNAGTHVITPSVTIHDHGSTFNGTPLGGNQDGNPYDPTLIPEFALATPTSVQGLWVGLSVGAPFGLAEDYGSDWFGRFDSTKTELTTINIQPSIAYKLNDQWSIGGGVDIQYANARLESAISNVASTGTSTLKGDDTAYGYNLGVLWKPMDGTSIGATYRSAIHHTLDGRIMVSGLTSGNFNTGGQADLDLPDIETLGITQEIDPQWRVMTQLSRFGWSNFRDITAYSDSGTQLSQTLQNYRDTITFSLGTEYDINPAWTVRAGYQFDKTPTVDAYRTSRTPDGNRNWLTTGATYHIASNASLDLGAAYIDVHKEPIEVTRNSGLAVYDATAKGRIGIISAAFNYQF